MNVVVVRSVLCLLNGVYVSSWCAAVMKGWGVPYIWFGLWGSGEGLVYWVGVGVLGVMLGEGVWIGCGLYQCVG